MKHRGTWSVEFETNAGPGGIIRIPPGKEAEAGLKDGARVHVRLTPLSLARQLRRRGITEAEIARIAARQMEPREHVVRCLFAEGVLAGRPVFRSGGGQ